MLFRASPVFGQLLVSVAQAMYTHAAAGPCEREMAGSVGPRLGNENLVSSWQDRDQRAADEFGSARWCPQGDSNP